MLAHASVEMCDGPRFIDLPESSAGKNKRGQPGPKPRYRF